MFTTIFFLILTLLVVNLAPEAELTSISGTPAEGLAAGLALYGALLVLILCQNWLFLNRGWRLKSGLTMLTSIELLLFFSVYHFLLLAHRAYIDVADRAAFNTLLALVSLALYFFALALFHYSSHRPLQNTVMPLGRGRYTMMQIRFLLPFAFPFLAFEFLFDLLEVIPSEALARAMEGEGDPIIRWALFTGILLFFLANMLLFLPPIIQRFWGCEELEGGSLKQRLDALCERAKFRHGGLKIWTVMNHSVTAAIIGILPRLRYVMFTEGLLRQMPPEQIEAILAHEIGHSKRKHLLIYPLVILGMVVAVAFFSIFFNDAIFDRLTLQRLISPGSAWNAVTPFALFLPVAVIALLYFRFVFGFFSRNFERQADLHVFELDVHPEHLVGALHGVAVASGGIHKLPNWHHYSIQERIDYLHTCMRDPSLVPRHHRRVGRILLAYLCILGISVGFLLGSNSERLPIARWLTETSQAIQKRVNTALREEVASAIYDEHRLQGNHQIILPVIERNLLDYRVTPIPGVIEFYAAKELSELGETDASLTLLTAAWREFRFELEAPSIMQDFEVVTREVITEALRREKGHEKIKVLIDVMIEAKARVEKIRINGTPSEKPSSYSSPIRRLIKRSRRS